MSTGAFHPAVQQWFSETFGAPTRAQELAWPLIAGGEHVLLVAPTGSGKTLAAFLALPWCRAFNVLVTWAPLA